MSLFQAAVLQKYLKQQDAASVDGLVSQLYGLTDEVVAGTSGMLLDADSNSEAHNAI